MNKRHASHRQALRQLFERFGIERVDGSQKRRDLLIDEILRVSDRFNASPSWLDEAINSDDGTYKP